MYFIVDREFKNSVWFHNNGVLFYCHIDDMY